MATTHFATDGTLGVDLENVITSANNATLTGVGGKHALGTRVIGNNDSEWVYVYATAAITQYALVGIQASGTAQMMTSTLARGTTPMTFAISQQTFAAGDYGWVATDGKSLTVLTTAASTAGERLYTTATAGRVSTTYATAADVGVGGLVHSVTTGSTASSAPCVARNLVAIWPSLLAT